MSRLFSGCYDNLTLLATSVGPFVTRYGTYNRLLPADPEPGCDGHGLTFTAHRNETDRVIISQEDVHEVDLAVRELDGVGDPMFVEGFDDGRSADRRGVVGGRHMVLLSHCR